LGGRVFPSFGFRVLRFIGFPAPHCPGAEVGSGGMDAGASGGGALFDSLDWTDALCELPSSSYSANVSSLNSTKTCVGAPSAPPEKRTFDTPWPRYFTSVGGEVVLSYKNAWASEPDTCTIRRPSGLFVMLPALETAGAAGGAWISARSTVTPAPS